MDAKIIAAVTAEIESCRDEAVRQGYTGAPSEYELTEDDCVSVVKATTERFGRAPTKAEWGEAGLSYVGGAHCADEVDVRSWKSQGTPRREQGQMAVSEYGWCEGEYLRRTTDRSDRSVTWYRAVDSDEVPESYVAGGEDRPPRCEWERIGVR